MAKAFCKFTVGTPGASAVHIRYITRVDAVREKLSGCFFRNVPDEVGAAIQYRELRANVESFAWAREEAEKREHRRSGRAGRGRSHYRCVLSFENDMATPAISRMVRDWLVQSIPLGVVCGFVHRNTEKVHVHLWIDARGIDGKKLDFSAREWRNIGSRWNRIYQRELSRIDRLEAKLGLTSHDERRAGGGEFRLEERTWQNKTDLPKARQTEPEARLCITARKRAIREVVGLREDLTNMVYRREPKGLER